MAVNGGNVMKQSDSGERLGRKNAPKSLFMVGSVRQHKDDHPHLRASQEPASVIDLRQDDLVELDVSPVADGSDPIDALLPENAGLVMKLMALEQLRAEGRISEAQCARKRDELQSAQATA